MLHNSLAYLVLDNMKAITVAFLLLFACPAFAADSCGVQIPSSLKIALDEVFPNFRAPLATDNLAEDVEWDLKEGRRGCLGVAVGDFDGDGTEDFLLGLTALRGSGALIVVALARGENWKLETLAKWPEGRSRLYVSTDAPGVYRRTEALGGPLEPGEVDPMTCSHSTVIFGATESSGVAYCYSDRGWRHVWISD